MLFLSLRASAVAIAWQSICVFSKVDSRVSTFWVFFLESAFADLWIATTSLRKSRDDRKRVSCEKVDSRVWELDLWGMDCHDFASAKSRNDSFLDSSAMDSKILGLESTLCALFLWIAAPPLSARNDDKNKDSNLEPLAVGFGSLCLFFLPLWDSKIFELKTAFFKPRKEDKT